jgi:protein-S-isoprenylcysteine O-methyltransferase Ste14
MPEPTHPGHVPHHLRRHPAFLASLAALIVVPPLFAFYLPGVVNLPDWMLLLAGWLAALLAILAIDEIWVREERKVMGALPQHHISHRLTRDPMFLAAIAVLVFAPPPIAFYLPQVGGADWIWLLVAWIVAVVAAAVAYAAVSREEQKELQAAG